MDLVIRRIFHDFNYEFHFYLPFMEVSREIWWWYLKELMGDWCGRSHRELKHYTMSCNPSKSLWNIRLYLHIMRSFGLEGALWVTICTTALNRLTWREKTQLDQIRISFPFVVRETFTLSIYYTSGSFGDHHHLRLKDAYKTRIPARFLIILISFWCNCPRQDVTSNTQTASSLFIRASGGTDFHGFYGVSHQYCHPPCRTVFIGHSLSPHE